MLEILDINRTRLAYLENAYSISGREPINDVGTLSFQLPRADPKYAHVHLLGYARWIDEDGTKSPLYRITGRKKKRTDVSTAVISCEHVVSKLADTVMPGYHVIGNIGIYTADVIRYVLSFQEDWVLEECDFERQFEYGWENENCLNALWSIPNRFTEPYIWLMNTDVYPYRISLKRIDASAEPKLFIRGGYNLMQLEDTENGQGIVTRIYPLGYGEGVNQLTIKSVNGGVEYLQSPEEYIEKYGIIERYLVDRRYEDAQSLMEYAQAVLEELQEPKRSAAVHITDIYQKSGVEYDRVELGRIVKIVEDDEDMDGLKSYITSIQRRYDVAGEISVTIANRPNDIASSIADLADRQRIETVYSQGATQIYAQSVQANASAEKGAILRFYIPNDMRIVNFVNAKITLDRFRSYSKATGGGGSGSQTSTSGGASTSTSGASSTTTTSTADAVISAFQLTVANLDPGSSYGTITNNSAYHQHVYAPNLPGHQHNMAHTHQVSTPDHKHSFNLPNHVHDIEQGIFEFGSASTADIYINGTLQGSMGKDLEMDISEYLLNDKRELPRGSWLSVEVRPNDLAYITIDLVIKGFVQSRGGGTY